jgi:hypothetical protein
MRKEVIAAVIAMLVLASSGIGYLAGDNNKGTETITSTFTSVSSSTTTSLLTVVSSTTAEKNLTTTVTSTAHPTGQPIPISSVETSNITVRGTPYIVGVDPARGRIYVTCGSSNPIIVIDASSHSVIANLTLPVSVDQGIAIHYSTDTFYVSLPAEGGVAEINGSTGVIGQILPFNLYSLAYDSTTHTLYGGSGGKSLAAVDAQTGALVANISLGYVVASVIVDPETDMVYASGCSSSVGCNSMASIVNGTSETLVNTVSIYSYARSTMTMDPVTGILYVSGGAQLRALNGTNGNVIYVSRPQTCQLSGMAVIPASGEVVAIPWMFDYLAVYDGASGALVNMYSFPSSPQSVAYNPNTDELYVTLPGQFLSFHDFPITGNLNGTLIGSDESCGP